MPRTTELSYLGTTTNLSFLSTLNDLTGRVNWYTLSTWILDLLEANSYFTRKTVSGIAELGAGTSQTITIEGFKSYMMPKIKANYPSRIRVYADTTSSVNDFNRSFGDPIPGTVTCFADVNLVSGQLTQVFSPGVMCFNNDPAPNKTMYVTVTNNDSEARTISADITILKLER